MSSIVHSLLPQKQRQNADFKPDLTQYMSTGTSVNPNSMFNLTHQGIWGIWTGQISPPSLASSPAVPPPRNARGSSSNSRNGNHSADPAVREPIRQGSAAWASLKSQNQPSQSHLSAGNINSGSGATAGLSNFRPRTLSSNSRARNSGILNSASQIPPPSDEYLAMVTGLYQQKVENGKGGISTRQSLPSGNRTACRRMILALCESGDHHYLQGEDVS